MKSPSLYFDVWNGAGSGVLEPVHLRRVALAATRINAPDLVVVNRTYGTRTGDVRILLPSPAMTLVGSDVLVFM